MSSLSLDCRHALRLYLHAPGASLLAVLVLAVSLACFGAFLSLYVDLALKPSSGFNGGHRIATVSRTGGADMTGLPYEFVSHLADDTNSIEAAALVSSAVTLVGPEERGTDIALVSHGFFGGLRPMLELGNGLAAEDHAANAEPVVVLSYAYWQQEFGGDRDVIGRSLVIKRSPNAPYRRGGFGANAPDAAAGSEDSAQFRIIGVMADSMSALPFPGAPFAPALWVAQERAWQLFVGLPDTLATANFLAVYIRRAPSASVTAVRQELRDRYSDTDSVLRPIPGTQLDVADGLVRNISVQREARRQLRLFLGGSLLLAIVAAANASLFLLARAPGRRRELAIRMAVGASVRRLARQLTTEAGLLVLVAGAIGLSGSIWLSLYFRGLSVLRDAEWQNVTLLDWRVMGLTGIVLLLLTSLVSLAPIIGIRQLGIEASSRATNARASLAQRLVGTAQIAVAASLGGAALAIAWNLGSLMFGDSGYTITNRYLIEGAASMPSGVRELRFVEYFRRREVIEAIPGVSAMAFGSPVPGEVAPSPSIAIPMPDGPDTRVDAYLGSMNVGFVDLLDFTLLHGRAPEDTETDVVVLNQSLARALWGREDVVGESLPENFRWGESGARVIGIVEDIAFAHPAAAPVPYVFSTVGSPGVPVSAVAESQLSSQKLMQELDRIVDEGGLESEVTDVRSLDTIRKAVLVDDRARGSLTLATAILALVLAGFGFYGTQQYLVASGRREYAIRASLGAGPSALGRLVLWRGLALGFPGIIGGSLLAFIAVAALRDELLARSVSPAAISALVAVGIVLIVLGASWMPARKARNIAPAVLLRQE